MKLNCFRFNKKLVYNRKPPHIHNKHIINVIITHSNVIIILYTSYLKNENNINLFSNINKLISGLNE